MKKFLLAMLLPLLPVAAGAVTEKDLLPPDQAFRFAAHQEGDVIRAEWDIADGYYLYRNKLRFATTTPGIRLANPQLPAAKAKNDEFFGKVEIYHGKVAITLPFKNTGGAPRELTLTGESQGCADAGVCYPPQRRIVKIALAKGVARASVSSGSVLASSALAKLLPMGGADGASEMLPADEAFRLTTEVVDPDTVVAHWQIAPGHYLYRDKFTVALKSGKDLRLGKTQIPAGEEKNDEFFGPIQIFHKDVAIRIPLQRGDTSEQQATLEFGYQGCAEAGICYPPIHKQMQVDLPAVRTFASMPAARVSQGTAGGTLSEQDSLAASLAGGDKIATIFTFFGLGLLLAFTPCVFPMIPILSSIIVGQGQLTTRRAFALSSSYVLAMALTYTVAGVLAGLFGSNLQATFQNPWILGAFAAVFVLLALSMFGFFELQLPSGLQSRISDLSNKQQSGSLLGVAAMGLLSALIVGPCVAPPLMGALIYIGQTGDAVLGGVALFAMSLGMGAPLLVIGTSAGKILPRAGAWMDAVKAVFGVLLLAVAVWMLERILPGEITMVLWALLLIVPAIYMGAIEQLGEKASGWRTLWKGLGVVMLLYGALILIGVSSGGSDPLSPLAHLRLAAASSGAGNLTRTAHLNFKRIKTEGDLDRELALAKGAGKSVMLDFYADWCVSCREFDKYTFSDPGVQQALADAVLLQVDVTANDDADKALLRRFRLIGPPAILFFSAHGSESVRQRVVGYMEPREFRAKIEQAFRL